MAERALDLLYDGGSFFEGPRWHDGRWFVSDFFRHQVFAIAPDGEAESVVTLDGEGVPSGLGWLPDGSLLISSKLDRTVYRLQADGALHTHADLGALAPGNINDMVVDGTGRAWVGNEGPGFDAVAGDLVARPTNLIRVDLDGHADVVADGIWFPNGCVVTPDGSTLVVGESFGNRYVAFTIGEDGALGDRRIWAELGPPPPEGADSLGVEAITVGVDGCCLDAEGCIWVGAALQGRFVRVAEGGKILDEIVAPEGFHAVACMLGGEDGCTMLLCVNDPRHDPVLRTARLFTTRVDVPGAGWP
jgi:sugar lactone lactonase YvrE